MKKKEKIYAKLKSHWNKWQICVKTSAVHGDLKHHKGATLNNVDWFCHINQVNSSSIQPLIKFWFAALVAVYAEN